MRDPTRPRTCARGNATQAPAEASVGGAVSGDEPIPMGQLQRHAHILFGLGLALVIWASPASAAPAPLRVGVLALPPWIVRTPAGTFDGFVVRIWQQIAARLGCAYTFVPLPTLEDQLAQVERGAIDIALGPLAISAQRARRPITFSQPYYASHLAILTFGQPPTLWDRLQPFLRLIFSVFAGGLLLSLFIVGNIVWWCEHESNPGIAKRWSRGVMDGMWLALVTMTTVGYGDRVPITGWGRLTMSFWMIAATMLTSLLTASLTTTFTVSNIDTAVVKGPDALAGKRVAVVRGTVGAAFAESYHALEIGAPTFNAALDLLRTHRAEAVVYDEPSLRFYLEQNPSDSLTIIPVAWQWETLGFALPPASPLLKPINVALLDLIEHGTLHDIHLGWAATLDPSPSPTPQDVLASPSGQEKAPSSAPPPVPQAPAP